MSIDPDNTKSVLHASVPEAMAAQLKALATAQDRSVSAELRRAVAEHIRQHEEARNDA
jgi:hypothetical protein